MKKEEVLKQLIPGLIIGFILGLILITLIGVDTENEVPNIVGGVMSCLIPQLLNGIIVLKGTAKVLNRNLSVGQALLKNIPYMIIAAIIGFIFAKGILMMALDIDLRTIEPLHNTLIFASLGAIVSTLLSYFLLKQYEKNN
ncbi:MAG: hypothetical protein PHE54_03175 [Bacilli bacterium]|nr:hypothetical protein [Bacilli bacterium]